MSHVLVIDIGNTRAKYAVFSGREIIESSVFNPYSDDLKRLTKRHPYINKGILSSVGGKIAECCKQLEGIELTILSGDTPLPFKVEYDKKQVGSDRLVAVAAAMSEKPNQNNLVIDIGTCITYDIITKDNVYYGGPISPGINLRFKSMHDYTEKLPLLETENLREGLRTTGYGLRTTDTGHSTSSGTSHSTGSGTGHSTSSSTEQESTEVQIPICSNTIECLESGVIMGISCEIEGFIKRFSNIYDMLNVFIIGGDNIFFENQLKNCIFADANFTFNGLRYILNYQ